MDLIEKFLLVMIVLIILALAVSSISETLRWGNPKKKPGSKTKKGKK